MSKSATAENMHVERRFSVKEHLREGENSIRIRFDSAVYYARENMEKLGELPHASSFSNSEPFHFIRKNACNFGWDWGPGLTTAGVWKPIRLESWSVARIKSVRPLVKVANEKVAVVDLEVEVESADGKEASLEGVTFAAEISPRKERPLIYQGFSHQGKLKFSNTFSLTVRDPQLWWPIGYGEQPLYHLYMQLDGFDRAESLDLDTEEHEFELDEFNCKIGLREVELDTSPDEIGAAWT